MSGHQIYKDNNACSQNPQRQQCPEDSKIFKIIRTRMSSNYKNKNVLKFTRAMDNNVLGQICPQNLQGQQCPQDYEDKNVLKIYKDSNVLKIMRTKISSKFTRTTMPSKL
ncbi:uncharacterized protein OCT59_019085 [Rhizophagus irregularis]|uniref:uncharacterized protein n=1 Tax=Rhizophagus irregularis TaxID=588596 RepID=UPI003329411D|nr:hypothetical protein OCT59_019085 [Rhizophagus irregularis]